MHFKRAAPARIEQGDVHVPARLGATSPENRLPVAVATLVAIALQLRLPDRYGLHPRWLVPGLELVLLVILSALNPVRLNRSSRLGRLASIGVVAAITLDNGVSALALDYSIVVGAISAGGCVVACHRCLPAGLAYPGRWLPHARQTR